MKRFYDYIDREILRKVKETPTEDAFFTPSDKVWKGVRPHLPKRKNRKFLLWWLFSGLLLLVTWFFWPSSPFTSTILSQKENITTLKAPTSSPENDSSTETDDPMDTIMDTGSSKDHLTQGIKKKPVKGLATDANSYPRSHNNKLSNGHAGDNPLPIFSSNQIGTISRAPTKQAEALATVPPYTIQYIDSTQTRLNQSKEDLLHSLKAKEQVETTVLRQPPTFLENKRLMLMPVFEGIDLPKRMLIPSPVPPKAQVYILVLGSVEQTSFLTTPSFDATFEALAYFSDKPVKTGGGIGAGVQLGKHWYTEASYLQSTYKLLSGHNSSFEMTANATGDSIHALYDLNLVTPLGTMPSTLSIQSGATIEAGTTLQLGFDNFQRVRQHAFRWEAGYRIPFSSRVGVQVGTLLQYTNIVVQKQGVQAIRNTDSRFSTHSEEPTANLSRQFWMLGGNVTAYYQWNALQVFGRLSFLQSISEVHRYEAGPLHQRNIGLQLGIRRYIF